MPPLTKTCPKMVLSDKGGSLCVKDVFARKFFGAGRVSAGGALASVLRKHSSEGRIPDAAERCVRHCAGVSPSGQGLAAPIQRPRQLRRISRIYRATDIRLRATDPLQDLLMSTLIARWRWQTPMRAGRPQSRGKPTSDMSLGFWET